jgi:hypothetical protein
MSQYNWNIKSFAKGIDPDEAAAEFERIENVFGSITPETILAASTPVDALFHNLFEWDDTEAATKYRLHQARTIINNIQLTIITDGASRVVSAYEVVKTENFRGYKSITTLSSDEVTQVKNRTIRDLNVLKEKLQVYKKFDAAIPHLDAALENIKSV